MARTNIDARLAVLKAKRREDTITAAERRELDRLEVRTRTLVEWLAEPTDEHGDVIDPAHFDSYAAAVAAVGDLLADNPEAAYVDVARQQVSGCDADGVTDRVWDYRTRHYRDGRVVTLRTVGGETPAEVTP